jgi:uncharacterized membrane protein
MGTALQPSHLIASLQRIGKSGYTAGFFLALVLGLITKLLTHITGDALSAIGISLTIITTIVLCILVFQLRTRDLWRQRSRRHSICLLFAALIASASAPILGGALLLFALRDQLVELLSGVSTILASALRRIATAAIWLIADRIVARDTARAPHIWPTIQTADIPRTCWVAEPHAPRAPPQI